LVLIIRFCRFFFIIRFFKNYDVKLEYEFAVRFEKHWFPELPSKGQAYRCIRINGISPIDLTLERAASKCGSSYRDLRLPTELTVWVDPSEVCYRLGESEGSYCTLATFPSENRSSSSENSTPTTSPPSTPLQDKFRKVQRPIIQQRYSTDFSNKYRNSQNTFLSSLRVKSSSNDPNFNLSSNRQICRGPFPANPAFYKNMNINRTHYKNVCRV
jgi:protein Tob/BTG